MTLDFLQDFDFFTGVPDSLLRPVCDYLLERCGLGAQHLIAANEGNAVALAAGHYLATGRVPVVYLQNSGLGNIINPVASLLHPRVYGIPCLFLVGWRGEPGVSDEPQHVFQGEATLPLLRDMEIDAFVLTRETTETELREQLARWQGLFRAGRQAALVVEKGALDFPRKLTYQNSYSLRREEAIGLVAAAAGEDVIVSTTGKASRELFELRERSGAGHERDFLTVGSMGHASSLALGVALARPEKRVWVIDGDGAVLMHMGALALLGSRRPENLIHVIINNGAHESVGGMPTVAGEIDLVAIARGCGYPLALRCDSAPALSAALAQARAARQLTLIEVKAAIGARSELGRPTTTPQENKASFMDFLGR